MKLDLFGVALNIEHYGMKYVSDILMKQDDFVLKISHKHYTTYATFLMDNVGVGYELR